MLTKHLVKAIKNRKSILTQDAEIDWDDIYTQDGPNYYEAITQVARRANNPRATREFIRAQLEPIFSAHQVPFDLKGFEKAYTEFNQAKMSKNIFDKKTKDSDIKNIKSVPYKGFIIDVYEDLTVYYGDKYFARNNTGEPYLQTKKFRTPEMAIAWEKNNIDAYTNDSKTKDDASIFHYRGIHLKTVKENGEVYWTGWSPTGGKIYIVKSRGIDFAKKYIDGVIDGTEYGRRYSSKDGWRDYKATLSRKIDDLNKDIRYYLSHGNGTEVNRLTEIRNNLSNKKTQLASIEQAANVRGEKYAEEMFKKHWSAFDGDPRGYKVTDQIIKGFMIYKSGKPNMFTAKNESGEQYEGTMEEIKKKIDAYWVKRDEDVMKQKVNDGVTSTCQSCGEVHSFPDKYANTYQPCPYCGANMYLFDPTIKNDSKTKDKSPQLDEDVMKQKVKDHGYVVNRMGNYHIIEGAGVDGGWWFAKEVRGKGKLETKKFKTRAQAEEHARMSQPNLDEDVMKQKVKDSSKTKDKVYFVNATVEQNGQKKKLNKPMNANSDEEAKESFKKFILAQFPSTKILEMTIDAKTKDGKVEIVEANGLWEVMKQKVKDSSKSMTNLVKKLNNAGFQTQVSVYQVTVMENGKEVGVFAENNDGSFSVEGMSSKKLYQWITSNGGSVVSLSNGLMKFPAQDSKTKDGIKYPHPRFRIKDDKLFILKNAVKKMK